MSEGSKTEPNYLHEIRQIYRLHTANLAVYPSELGTAPIQVVEYAKTLFEQGDARKSIPPRAFEQVYAVFDRDDHNSYVNALNLAESLDGKLKNDCKQGVRFQAIASVPSFELWLLLHYEDIQAPIHRKEVMARLKKHLPHYEKAYLALLASLKRNCPWRCSVQRLWLQSSVPAPNRSHSPPWPCWSKY